MSTRFQANNAVEQIRKALAEENCQEAAQILREMRAYLTAHTADELLSLRDQLPHWRREATELRNSHSKQLRKLMRGRQKLNAYRDVGG